MTQREFALELPPQPRARARGGWERLSRPGDKCRAEWRHIESGWLVRHCGHPTANWPYYAVDPAHPNTTTVTHNGLGFRRLEDAFSAIAAVLAGKARATDENCVPGVRCIVFPKNED